MRIAAEELREAATASRRAIEESKQVLKTAGSFWFAQVVAMYCG